jgi:hypothetical protein
MKSDFIEALPTAVYVSIYLHPEIFLKQSNGILITHRPVITPSPIFPLAALASTGKKSKR